MLLVHVNVMPWNENCVGASEDFLWNDSNVTLNLLTKLCFRNVEKGEDLETGQGPSKVKREKSISIL